MKVIKIGGGSLKGRKKLQDVAVYFLVRNKDLQKSVEAIHTTFFSTSL
jgi:aspartokinase